MAWLAEHLPPDNRSDREKLGRHQLLPLFKRELGGAAEELVGIMYCGWHECSESGVDHEDQSFGTSTSRGLSSVLVERTYCEGCNRSSEWRIPDWCEHVWYKRIGDGEHFIPKSWNDSDRSALTRPQKVLLAQDELVIPGCSSRPLLEDPGAPWTHRSSFAITIPLPSTPVNVDADHVSDVGRTSAAYLSPAHFDAIPSDASTRFRQVVLDYGLELGKAGVTTVGAPQMAPRAEEGDTAGSSGAKEDDSKRKKERCVRRIEESGAAMDHLAVQRIVFVIDWRSASTQTGVCNEVI